LTAIKRAAKQIANGEPGMPRVGDKERLYLNELQTHTNYKIIRQDQKFKYTICRFPDGYISELKLFILFDELFHFEDKECTQLNEASIIETRDYESLEGYRLFRVSEKDWLNNRQLIINQFKHLIMEINNNVHTAHTL